MTSAAPISTMFLMMYWPSRVGEQSNGLVTDWASEWASGGLDEGHGESETG